MASEAPLPTNHQSYEHPPLSSNPPSSTPNATTSFTRQGDPEVLTTIYKWPDLEPLRFESYSSKHLHLPLRRDILHRAVIYEGDMARKGTASTKWRDDVHGSGVKIQAQKGTGRARVGDKKSPIRRGGGVAHGPKPRDFSTGLQRKVYDLAWRTALSYRYRRGELVVVDNKIALEKHTGARLLTNIFQGNQWGSGFGRATLVTTAYRERLFREMGELKKHGIVKDMFDIDVKDLLETGRIVIEKQALDTILKAHTSDIGAKHSMEYAAKLVARSRQLAGITEELEEVDDEEAASSDMYGDGNMAELENMEDFDAYETETPGRARV
jgi:large subunit ribosomal protein L4